MVAGPLPLVKLTDAGNVGVYEWLGESVAGPDHCREWLPPYCASTLPYWSCTVTLTVNCTPALGLTGVESLKILDAMPTVIGVEPLTEPAVRRIVVLWAS